jgi:signal transduction histidine kinase
MLAVVAEGHTGAVPEKALEMVARTRERLRGMLDLAHDLLSLSQARSGSGETPREPVDLDQVLRAMEPDFRHEAAAAGVELLCSGAPGAVVEGVPEALAELLENLVSNAVKYTPAGGKVEVSLVERAGGPELAVSDTGMGIPAEEQASVFQEFFRASNARQATRSGTGLGLSIVTAIAAAHGAEVKLESVVGAGTTVRVLFPRATAVATEGAAV